MESLDELVQHPAAGDDLSLEIEVATSGLTPAVGASYPEPLASRPPVIMLLCPFCRIVLGPSETTCPRDGRPGLNAEIDPLPADLQARFTIVQPLAAGDTGTLYVADETDTGRRGVLKLLRNTAKANLAERQRLKRELVKQATISNPHLTLPVSTGEASGVTWLFREWVDGVSLRVRLMREGRLPTPEALAVAAQVATALDELHRAGLLHRDVKPGHVMLMPQPSGVPRATLVDSGVAAHLATGAVFEVLGTAAYVSPEQAAGKLVSFRSDLYSLGCLLYEMLSGAPPFSGDDAALLKAHAEQAPPAPPAQLPTGIASLLTSLLAKEPRERPFSAQQVRRALEPFLPEASGGTREPTQSFADSPSAQMAMADAVRTATPAPIGTGTLRPPEVQKMTLLGMPAAPPAQPPQTPRVSTPPPPPPGALKKSADTTQELQALDIEEEILADEVATTTPGSPVAAASAPRSQDLDYDDLAPTTALDKAPDLEALGALVGKPASVPPPPPPGALRPSAAAPAQVPPTATFPAGPPSGVVVSPEAFAATIAPGQMATPVGLGAPSDAAPMFDPNYPQAVAAPPPTQATPAFGAAAAPGAFPAAQSVWGSDQAYPAPAPPTFEEDVVPVRQAQKKKKKGGLGPILLLVGLVAFCGIASVVGGVAYLVLGRTTPPEIASLGGEPTAPDLTGWVPQVNIPEIGTGTGTTATGTGTTATGTGTTATGTGTTPTGTGTTAAGTGTDPATTATGTGTTATGTGTTVPGAGTQPTAQATVHVTVDSNPPHAQIVVNGGPPVRAPVTLELPRDSIVEASATMDGYNGAEQSMTLSGDATMTITLQPRPREAVATGSHTTGTTATGTGSHTTGTATGSHTTGTGTGTTTGRDHHETTTTPPPSGAVTFEQLREQARVHYAAQRYREAASAYERAVAMNPTHAGTFAGLGGSRLAMRDFRGAIAAYEKAVRLQPSSSGFNAALGRAYAQSGDRTRAIASFRRALELDANNGAARQGLTALGAQ